MKQSRGSRALVGKTAIKFADKYFCLVYYYYLLNNSRDRNPAGGGRFFAPVHIGHGTRPFSCKIGTASLFRAKTAEA
jgi:hypothetical protein